MSVQIILVPSIVTKEETQLRQYSYVTYLDFASIPLWKQEMRRERRIKNSVFMWDIYFYGRLVCSLYTTCNTHLTVLFSSPLNLPIEFINISRNFYRSENIYLLLSTTYKLLQHFLYFRALRIHQSEGSDVCSTVFELFQVHGV